jgi:hypothetical protein
MLGVPSFIQADNDLQGMWLLHEDKNKTQNGRVPNRKVVEKWLLQ